MGTGQILPSRSPEPSSEFTPAETVSKQLVNPWSPTQTLKIQPSRAGVIREPDHLSKKGFYSL